MSSRILTTSIAGIDAFIGATFYLVAANRINKHGLLFAWATVYGLIRLSRPASDVTLDNQFFEEPGNAPVTVPMGKFALYAGWHPDVDFQRQAALWGIALTQPATPEELAAFIAWWQAEGKVFTHIQWQQKLARHLQINRASNNGQPKRDINAFSEPDKQIPNGFRGAK